MIKTLKIFITQQCQINQINCQHYCICEPSVDKPETCLNFEKNTWRQNTWIKSISVFLGKNVQLLRKYFSVQK